MKNGLTGNKTILNQYNTLELLKQSQKLAPASIR